ncbi:cell growth-regulating nucleolar protein [Drosophila obscura]|uniref:cell growth-regulating nucleolar protein n=1 Tax=Drosophila obscura TaxID=7282 RepID=UPI001BB1F4C9|nr:cell growth-regulating nucleolar protein [Drosophila obscura]XP_022232321.2 cell growth-regulating nucleolar protein [Drosophila obscura]
MVFFTCNICGESVKKPSVEKHYQTRCRGNEKNVSCMDCLKDFYGEEYVAHTKCISEAQKYANQNQSFVAKESRNKNAQKQESWMDIIRAILDSSEYNLTPALRTAFQRLQSVDNVPRKRAKFENFVGNCMRMPRQQATQVWDILEKELNKMKEAKQEELARAKAAKEKALNGKTEKKDDTEVDAEEEAPPKKKSKVAAEPEPESEAAPEASESSNDFDWPTQLAKIVAKQADGIFLEKLKKKLLKKYSKHVSVDELSEKQAKKFHKRFEKQLKLCATLRLDGDLVKSC